MIAGISKQAEGLGGTMAKMGRYSVEALGAIAAESVRMATTYESVTTRLVTSAGEQNKNLKMVQDGMLNMAGQVGVSAIDLAKAMYYVESAGFHGADALTALKAAAQGAAAEGADTTTVVKAMTDVLVDYHLKASDAADVTSKMITAVSFGKTSLQEFSGAFASIVPAASAAGISFNDVAAALAEMTNHGFTANRASQNLAQALRSLLNPTGPMTSAFVKYGVDAQTLRDKLAGPNGLTDAMEYLSQKAEKAGKEGTPAFAAALKLLMGTAPGANAALATVGENFKATSAAIKGIGGATTDASGNVQGFAEIQKTLGQQTKQLQASFDSLMIEMGQKLLPVIMNVVSWMNKHHDTVVLLIEVFAVLGASTIALGAAMKVAGAAQALWAAASKAAAAATWLMNDAAIGTRIGLAALAIQEGVTAAASKAFAAAQWLLNAAMDASPILLIIAAIAALGFAIYELVAHWKTVWADIKKWAADAWHFIYDGFGKYLLPLLGPVGLIALGAIELVKHWRQVWDLIKHIASDFYQWIWTDFGQKIYDFFTKTVPKWFDAATGAIAAAWGAVYNAIIAPVKHAYDDVMGLVNTMIGGIETLLGIANRSAGQVGSDVGNMANMIAGSVSRAGSAPSGGGHALSGMAAGGAVGAAAWGGAQGGWTWMNERGAELVHLPMGATVMPHSNTVSSLMRAGGSGAGGGTVVLEVAPGGASAFEQFMVEALRRWVRARAGNAANSVQKAFGQSF